MTDSNRARAERFYTTVNHGHSHFIKHGAEFTTPAKAPGATKEHVHYVTWENGRPKVHEAEGHTHGIKPE